MNVCFCVCIYILCVDMRLPQWVSCGVLKRPERGGGRHSPLKGQIYYYYAIDIRVMQYYNSVLPSEIILHAVPTFI